ncbi:hypothetical protein DK419_25745 [Methylobacterium terrae]|uniref:Uncharacterized protein n=1 Tax=Methylobacterium terrae TaxID=2202827 RepID=A0A2U8WVP4_9HYPH|nr:hypothetical protein DK419_25745 [Methylobacterium terrae]
MQALLPATSNAPLFLHLAGALVFVAAAGRGIGWALDAWVRRAPDGTAAPSSPEERPLRGGAPSREGPGPAPQSGARIR